MRTSSVLRLDVPPSARSEINCISSRTPVQTVLRRRLIAFDCAASVGTRCRRSLLASTPRECASSLAVPRSPSVLAAAYLQY
eukprot:3764920-Rhodomonas_salina.2